LIRVNARPNVILVSAARGKLMRTVLAGVAEFERNLFRDRVKSGHAVAKARGVALGRPVGKRPSDKHADRVLAMLKRGLSYRQIARKLRLSKNTIMVIARRARASDASPVFPSSRPLSGRQGQSRTLGNR
jgi:DNA invertase Pin-like site-specific DNA recombinase